MLLSSTRTSHRLSHREWVRLYTIRFSSNGASPRWTQPIFSSSRLTLHKSAFEAHVSPLPRALLSGSQDRNGSADSASSAAVESALDGLFAELAHLNPRTKRATHCMYAWRVAVPVPSPSPGSTAPPSRASRAAKRASVAPVPPSTHVLSASHSGGESGAGERLDRLLELSQDCRGRDVVLVVYRWYGGVKLGNDRWKCISGVAKEALGVAAGKEWK